MRHKTELLAPAGSFDSLRAAVNAGADAVYIGGSRFGARAYADNPEEKELCEGIKFAHLHGCDLYLTVNTLLKDAELCELGRYIKPYYESGLDAVIVQDLGVFSYIREFFPDLPIHASTQMTVLGQDGAAFLKEQGASRVVTARELSLAEIRNIRDQVDIEIESFVHGALCYCYSGQCLFSSMLGGRSGNRGRCAQPCRLPYRWKNGKQVLNSPRESYLLSPKDMCTIEILPDILEAGVCSLKIEGRMKRPEYTAGVVRIYRKYLDRYLESGREAYHVEKKDYQELERLYSRGGFSRGYYQVHNGREMMSLENSGHFEKKGQGALRKKQEYEALLAVLKKEYLEKEKKEKIQGTFRISAGSPSEFVVRFQEMTVSVSGDPGQIPKNRPMTCQEAEKQLRKTGDTPFVFDSLDIEMDKEVFCPVGQLNQMRRSALKKLEEAVLEKGFRKAPEEFFYPELTQEKTEKTPVLRVQLENLQFLPDILKVPEVSGVYLSSERLELDETGKYAEACHRAGKECMLVLPAIFRAGAREMFEKNLPLLQKSGLDGVVIKNLEELNFIRGCGWEIPMIADHNLYTWNRKARTFLKEAGVVRDTLPLEENERELEARGCENSEMIVYGYLPLMITASCVHKTIEGCDSRPVRRMLEDRYKKEFPVMNYCRYCYNIVYNCEPLSLLYSKKETERLLPESFRLCFTMEDREKTRRILSDFTEVFCRGREKEKPQSGYTKGHLRRGVQ